MGRWKRTDHISPVEEIELNKIIKGTKGMTRYGNRARTSIMLPLEVARQVSFMSKQSERTVSEVVVSMIETMKVLKTNGSKKQELDRIMDKEKALHVKKAIRKLKKDLGDEYFMSIHIKRK